MNKSKFITEKTPSKSEYFSWINNTNEGSTEANTLANLDFFDYLHKNYSMTLDIYALDAGNLDGPSNNYESLDSEKIKKQFPNGYKTIVDKAKQINTRLGVWGGADGYGNTLSSAKKRHDLLVRLCKDYNFALFKFDTVCGELRQSMQHNFEKTMNDCRKYSKDLIVLNHRNDLGDASYHATTFLWEGLETYTDVHCYNKVCASHNRAYIFYRGYTPENKRLTEDHGVCISSSIDYFEDDLVYQAFNRCLILSPEIYGNPWFLRDDELPIFAHIFNLHRYYKNILVDGMIPKNIDLGMNPIIRGSNNQRFISTGNASWNIKKISIPLDETIGLNTKEEIACVIRFPYEEFIGIYKYGSKVDIDLLPFRASLIEVVALSKLRPVLINAKYQIEKEDENLNILEAKILKNSKDVYLFKNGNKQLISSDIIDDIENIPIKITELVEKPLPNNLEELYERIYFSLDNDSLELRSLKRSGKSNIKEINICRDFFFNQDSYKKRGLDSNIPFDKNDDTIYDTKSVSYYNHDGRKGFRVLGGELRIDLLKEYDINEVKISYFDAHSNPPHMFSKQEVKDLLETSIDLKSWNKASLTSINTIKHIKQPVYAYYSDTYEEIDGDKMEAVFKLNVEKARYLRLPEQVDRIYNIKFYKNEKEIDVKTPHLNNLFAPYYKRRIKHYMENDFIIESLNRYPLLVVAVNGYTGYENVACGIEIDGQSFGAPRRAPEYPSNCFEYPVHPVDSNYSFFIPVKKEWLNKKAKIFLLFGEDEKLDELPNVTVYMSDEHKKRDGKIIKVND